MDQGEDEEEEEEEEEENEGSRGEREREFSCALTSDSKLAAGEMRGIVPLGYMPRPVLSIVLAFSLSLSLSPR